MRHVRSRFPSRKVEFLLVCDEVGLQAACFNRACRLDWIRRFDAGGALHCARAVRMSRLGFDPDAPFWVADARRVPSPNEDARPRGVVIDAIVVHGISLPAGHFGGPHVEALFTNRIDPLAHPDFADLRDLRVSAHFLVRRDGELLQFVAVDRRAWHAGVSSLDGRERCNDFSVGIELEGTDCVPYTDAQYERLAALVTLLRGACPGITSQRIVGHSDIAPGRKTDPGPAFDWPRLRKLL